MDYIPIDSVNDISVNNISVRDINKRYVDRQGNRFATRFNLQKRRIEVVRLAKNHKEATNIRGAILRGKKDRLLAPGVVEPNKSTVAPPKVDHYTKPKESTDHSSSPVKQQEPIEQGSVDLDMDLDMDDSDFLDESTSLLENNNADQPLVVDAVNMLEQPFLEELSKELDRFKERQQVALNKMKDLPKELLDQQALEDIIREIDAECWQGADESVNYFKELYGYPRSLSQYLNRLPEDEKEKIDMLENDKVKMDIIKRIESARSFEKILHVFYDKSQEISGLIVSIPADLKSMAFSGKQKNWDELETSIQLLMQNAKQKIAEIKAWANKYAVIR